MKTQKGISIPDDFADALAAHPRLLDVLERIRPSCQRDYVDEISAAIDGEARAAQIRHVMSKITRWGKRHQLLTSDPVEN